MTGRGYKQTYTHSAYHSRGAMRRRDKIWEAVKTHNCIMCEKALERKITRRGYPEQIRNWLRRKTCGYQLIDGKLKKTECLLAYQSGEYNGNYKGLMDRKCRLCGKKGLSYVCKREKLPELCFKCHNIKGIRGESYNHRDDEVYNCTACGKDIISRNKNGSFRYKKNGKVFCSYHCANTTRDRKRIPVACVVCGKIKLFIPSRAKSVRTCGLICNGKLGGGKRKIWFSREENKKLFQEAQKARRQGKYCNCKVCGKEFYLYPSTRNTGKWCSKECELNGSRKWVNCIQCTDEFQVRNSEVKKIRRCENCRNNKNILKV